MAADKISELRMNLAAIKRVDPYAKDIIDNSAHVAFYTFNSDDREWEKTDIEGAFFVYSRNAEPYHSVFINNRLNTNSLVEPLTAGVELESQSPFLLYRNERNRIRGFWFYNGSECERISELIQQITKDAGPLTENQMNSNLPKQAFDLMNYSHGNVDIFSMLSKAQQDFNKSLIVSKGKGIPMPQSPVTPKIGGRDPIDKKYTPERSPLRAVNLANNTGTPESVLNFFAAAKPTQPKDGLQLQPGSSPLANFFASNNWAHSNPPQPTDVQTIESQRQKSEPKLQTLLMKPVSTSATSNASSNTASGKPAKLMPPTMFETTVSETIKQLTETQITNSKTGKNENRPETNKKSAGNQKSKKKTAHEPQPQAKQNDDLSATVQPLTETQLLQAIYYLMKNDPTFIRKIHEAYLKSFAEMVSQ